MIRTIPSAVFAVFAALATPLVGYSEPSVQTVLDGISGGQINASADRYSGGTFSLGAGQSLTATWIEAHAGLAGTNVFGIYDVADPGSLITIFSGIPATNAVTLEGLAPGEYGFFLSVDPSGDPYTVYSQSQLNPGDTTMAYLYQGTAGGIDLGTLGTLGLEDRLVAFEDLLANVGSDFDYNDLFVLADVSGGGGTGGISEAPEPASILAWVVVALAGLGFAVRRRKQLAAG